MKCLICGIELKFLGKHLEKEHNLTQKEYYDKYLKKPNEGKCLACGKDLNFIKLSKGYGLFCSIKCSTNSDYVRNKAKQTCLDRYGVENPYQTEYAKECSRNVKEKAIQTQKQRLLEKFGVENIWQRQDIIDKMVQQRKIKNAQFEKDNNCTLMKTLVSLYGEGWKQNDILAIPRLYYNHTAFIDNSYIPKIKEYFELHKIYSTSTQEQLIYSELKSVYSGTILQHQRKIIKPLELDIYLPDLQIAVEFNGSYWHAIEKGCTKEYHLNKSIRCRELNIRLIHIYQFEDLEEQIKLLKDLINGIDNYNKNDFNKNNLYGCIPEQPEIICDTPYTIYGASKLL